MFISSKGKKIPPVSFYKEGQRTARSLLGKGKVGAELNIRLVRSLDGKHFKTTCMLSELVPKGTLKVFNHSQHFGTSINVCNLNSL